MDKIAVVIGAGKSAAPNTTDADNSDAPELVIVPYIDTIEYFCVRYVPDGIRTHMENVIGRRRIIIEPALDRHGAVIGHRLAVHQPSPAALLMGNHLQDVHRYGAPISRVDIAVDWCFPVPNINVETHQWMGDHVILRWRRPGRMHRYSDTLYWVNQRDRKEQGQRRSARDVGLYHDRPSKITGVPCTHLELKFQNAEACRRQGWHQPSDLLRIDPHELFNKHLRLAICDLAGRGFTRAQHLKHRRPQLITATGPLTALCIPRKLVFLP